MLKIDCAQQLTWRSYKRAVLAAAEQPPVSVIFSASKNHHSPAKADHHKHSWYSNLGAPGSGLPRRASQEAWPGASSKVAEAAA